ncbi:hypothetical protein KCU98_g2885, partial [Aureobasidium melanogenum]
MELDIAPPPCSGAETVSQKSISTPGSRTSSKVVTGDHSNSVRCSPTLSISHRLASDRLLSPASSRNRLDVATTSKPLSAVTPADSKIIGLGIAFDDTLSSTTSSTSSADSMRNGKTKTQSTEAFNTLVSAPEAPPGAATPLQNNRSGIPVAGTGPPRWPSGVPGLGNTILGPRCPRISNASSSPLIPHHDTPDHNHNIILSVHATSSNDLPFVAPQSRKPSRATRTSTKRKPTSPPSGTGLSAKLAKVSVNPIHAQPPTVKREDEQAPKRFGPRRLGPSETEKRAKAAKLWQDEQEKINQQMERTITCGGVLIDETGSYIGKQHRVQERPQPLNTDPTRQGCIEVASRSPETNKVIGYACDSTDKAPRLSVEQDGELGASHESQKDFELARQRGRPEGRTTKLRQPRLRKQISQEPPQPDTTNTQIGRHALPSAIKTPTSTSISNSKRVSFTHPPHLDHLTNQFLTLLDPYTRLHHSCAAVRPLRLIHSSLSSIPPTATALTTAFKDTQELLKVLSNHQLATLAKLEGMKEELEKVGMDSVVCEAKKRVVDTEGDVRKLGEWMGECGYFGNEV